MPSKRQLMILCCLHTHEVAATIFTSTKLRGGNKRYPQNLALGLKCENGRAAVASDAPNASAASAAVDDEDALTIALRARAYADVGSGKFAAFNRAFTCQRSELADDGGGDDETTTPQVMFCPCISSKGGLL